MAEYIEREALLEHIAGLSIIITGLSRGRNQLAEFGIRYKNSILRGINDFPAADVAPVVHGRWAHLGGDEWCCSVCGFVITTEGSWDKPAKKYCEDCGAKMDGGADDES